MSSEYGPEPVGYRVAAARKMAGLTQHQLAERAHVSHSLVSQVERGTRPASPSFVTSVARALHIAPAHLHGMSVDEVVDQPSAESASIAELRVALDAYDDPRPEGRPLALEVISERLSGVDVELWAERMVAAATTLAPLLHHLYPLSKDSEAARAVLHDAYRMAASISGQLGQYDLAALASERHIGLAESTGDPLRVAVSAWHRSSRHLQHGDHRAGLRLLDRARGQLDATPAGRAMNVQLGLRSAVLAARAGDIREADGWASEARSIVDEFAPPERPYCNIDASSINTVVHWCALPVEQYDAAEAIRRGASAHVADRQRPERVGRHHIDQARAWTLHGNREKALDHLQAARQTSPWRTRRHPQVRETVRTLAATDRRRDDSLARFARWAGIRM
nr:helix-turn-helix domain-containing protein [Tamaricihabitans halophyticus]